MCSLDGIQNAVVQDGARLTRYVRAGNGIPLLVLWNHDDAAFQTAVSILATTFRVVAPQIQPGREFVEHLAAFADGAGLVGVQVLANTDFADQVIAFAEQGGWGNIVRCATVIANREDLEHAARVLCAQAAVGQLDGRRRTTVGSPQQHNAEE